MSAMHVQEVGLDDLVVGNAAAELSLIGEILLDNRVLDAVGDRLHPRDFVDPLFARVFEIILREVAAGRGVAPQSLTPHFADDEEFAHRRGAELLMTAYLRAVGLDDGGPFVGQIADLARRRRLADTFRAAAADIRRLDLEASAVTAGAIEAITADVPRDDDRPAMTIAEALAGVIERTWAIREGREPAALLLPAFSDWNDVTGGMRPGNLILLGGRPGMGKTALSLAVARRAGETGCGVLYISREMDTMQLTLRMAADMLFEAGSPVTMQQIMAGEVDNVAMRTLQALQAQAGGLPIIVEQPATLSIMQLGAMVRRHKRGMEARGWKLGLVIVDYLGLLEPPPGRSNREQEVSAISRELKAVASSASVPLIALTQLSRAVEQRDDKHPKLSDLRDSGSLEQDADTVVFVYREEYYLQGIEPLAYDAKRDEWEAKMQDARDRVEIYSAKVRQGQPTRRRSYFFGSRQAIRNSDFFRTGI